MDMWIIGSDRRRIQDPQEHGKRKRRTQWIVCWRRVSFSGCDDVKDRPPIHTGEAGDMIGRLGQYLERKDGRNGAVVLISKDTGLNKAHVKYLEDRSYNKGL